MEDNDAVITLEQLSTNQPQEQPRMMGRKAGFEHLKPMNLEDFMVKHNCVNIVIDHPWVRQLKLVSNPYMYRTLGKANYKTGTIELSEKVMKEPSFIQREVFVRTICHFIAKKLFDDAGEGKAYGLLVQRYMRKPKGQSNSTGTVTRIEEKEPESAE